MSISLIDKVVKDTKTPSAAVSIAPSPVNGGSSLRVSTVGKVVGSSETALVMPSISSGVFHIAADEPTNTVVQVNQTFAPADVNTSTGKITLPITGFLRGNNYEIGRVYFSSTGVLPSPLVADTPYVALNNGDGTFSFYPWNTNADYASFPSYENGETIVPGLSFSYDRNKIVFATQGTGTHTVYTNPLVSELKNKIGGATLFSTSTSNPEKMFELLTDAKGKYIYQSGMTGLPTSLVEPQGKAMGSPLSGSSLGSIFSGYRYIYSIAVVEPLVVRYISKGRVICSPSGVVPATGVFTLINHGIKTGDAVQYGVMSDTGAFPTPTVAFNPTIYARAVTLNTVTLHPTALDATNNTNAYVYSNSGSGNFYIAGSTYAKSAAGNRRILFDINMQSNDHAYSPITFDAQQSLPLNSATYFMSAGFGNGNLNFFLGNTAIGNNWSILQVDIFIPSGAVGPICTDTGQPLTTGTYWVTKRPNNSYRRLHRTLANAQSAVGVETTSLSDAQVIKYGTLGSGTGYVYCTDKFIYRAFDDGFNAQNALALNDFNSLGVFVSMVDYVDGSGFRRYYSGVNDDNNILDNQPSSYSSPLPASSAFSSLTFNNTGQPHVPGHFKTRELYVGRSNTDPTPDITAVNNYFKAKYSII